MIGNIKFDIELPKTLVADGRRLRQQLFGDRRVWIAASTHEDEEEQALAAHALLRERFPDLLLVLVPRHPARFRDVGKLVEQRGFKCVRRTAETSYDDATEVFLVDTMGELPLFYAASDVAFVGGSLVPVGGHNLLEPAALGLPVVIGPHVFNAEDIADMFLELGASLLVHDSNELASSVGDLIADPDAAARIGEKGRKIVLENRGSLSKLLGLLEPLIGDSVK